jgi:hypothetical protein
MGMNDYLCEALDIVSEAKRDQNLRASCHGQVCINGYKEHGRIEEMLWKRSGRRNHLNRIIIEHTDLDLRGKVSAAMSVRALSFLRELIPQLDRYWFIDNLYSFEDEGSLLAAVSLEDNEMLQILLEQDDLPSTARSLGRRKSFGRSMQLRRAPRLGR